MHNISVKIICIIILFYGTSIFGSTTSNELVPCKKMAADVLERCLMGDGEGCWVKSQQHYAACKKSVVEMHISNTTRINAERELRENRELKKASETQLNQNEQIECRGESFRFLISNSGVLEQESGIAWRIHKNTLKKTTLTLNIEPSVGSESSLVYVLSIPLPLPSEGTLAWNGSYESVEDIGGAFSTVTKQGTPSVTLLSCKLKFKQ
jgi:hypothetical protein